MAGFPVREPVPRSALLWSAAAINRASSSVKEEGALSLVAGIKFVIDPLKYFPFSLTAHNRGGFDHLLIGKPEYFLGGFCGHSATSTQTPPVE